MSNGISESMDCVAELPQTDSVRNDARLSE